ncbi:DoxX family protein [Herbaspirillum sp. GCM10030257]|uniref:DoxX family protein n=1 Tax=Herbaspirillum sp. GCM10030257 TaxID=3273393 RepID=UPI00361FAF44
MKPRRLKASSTRHAGHALDAGLLFLRLAGSFMLLYVHGWPKLINYSSELAIIEDPFGLGPHVSMWSALLAELLCPLFIAFGVRTRLACMPVIAVLLVAMFAVHPGWSLAEGQFGWLLLIIFTTIVLCGPGRWRLHVPFSAASV